MATALDLGTRARAFAEELQRVLNTTVCDNVHVSAVAKRDETIARVGTLLDKADFSTGKVQLLSRARTKIWLELSCFIYVNDEGFLTMRSSYCGIWLGDDHDDLLLHYDYERDKAEYTEAHIQVAGRHAGLEQLLTEIGRPTDQMKKLHLPVGGRRLRPSLEDLVESLIIERILDGKPGWEDVLNRSRYTYRQNQIGAVVRSNPQVAAAALRRIGWDVTPPAAVEPTLIQKVAGKIPRARHRRR